MRSYQKRNLTRYMLEFSPKAESCSQSSLQITCLSTTWKEANSNQRPQFLLIALIKPSKNHKILLAKFFKQRKRECFCFKAKV